MELDDWSPDIARRIAGELGIELAKRTLVQFWIRESNWPADLGHLADADAGTN